MAERTSRPARHLAVLALAGFSLGGASSRSARASSDTASCTLTTVGGIAGIVILVRKLQREGEEVEEVEEEEEEEQAEAAPSDWSGSLTHDLLWSGLLTQRGDLGLQVMLLGESPGAVAQLSDELGRGEGPALAALVDASGLPPAKLHLHWLEVFDPDRAPTSQSEAIALLAAFLVRVTPELAVDPQLLADYVWSLALELDATDGAGPTESWTARWLGVPTAAVRAASAAVFADIPGGSEGARQEHVQQNSAEYLVRIAWQLQWFHGDLVQLRVAQLFRQMGPWLPPGLGPLSPAP